jgi:hypothetical protein
MAHLPLSLNERGWQWGIAGWSPASSFVSAALSDEPHAGQTLSAYASRSAAGRRKGDAL